VSLTIPVPGFVEFRIDCPTSDPDIKGMSWRVFETMEDYRNGKYVREETNSVEFKDRLALTLDTRYGKSYLYTSKPFYDNPELDSRQEWDVPQPIISGGGGYTIGNVLIVTPNVDVPDIEFINNREVLVSISEFTMYAGSDKHKSTIAQIRDVSTGDIVYELVVEEEALLYSFKIGPVHNLGENIPYVLMVTFTSIGNNRSNPSAKPFTIRSKKRYGINVELEDFRFEQYSASNFLRVSHNRNDHQISKFTLQDLDGSIIASGSLTDMDSIVEIIKVTELSNTSYHMTVESIFKNIPIETQTFSVNVNTESHFRYVRKRPFVNSLITIPNFDIPFKTGQCQSEEVEDGMIPLLNIETATMVMCNFDEEDIVTKDKFSTLQLPSKLVSDGSSIEEYIILRINDAFLALSILIRNKNDTSVVKFYRLVYLVHFNKFTGEFNWAKEINLNSYTKVYPGFRSEVVEPEYREDDNISLFIANSNTIGLLTRDISTGYLDFLFVNMSGLVKHVYFDQQFSNEALPGVVNIDAKQILLVFNDRKVMRSSLNGDITNVLRSLSDTNVHDNAKRILVNRGGEIVVYTLDNNSIPISMIFNNKTYMWTNRKVLNDKHLSIPSIVELEDGDILSFNTKTNPTLVGQKLT